MDKTPTISIIVPVYNVEKYLHKCIDSILAQTYNNFELLLIDDGSPDNSGNICDEYARKDHRIRAFHKPNGGVSSARNMGIDNARGEFISFIDADDYIEPNFLEEMIKAMDEYRADLVCCGFMIGVKADGTHQGIVCPGGVRQYDRKQGLIEMIAPDGFWGTLWNKFYKTEIIKRAGISFLTDLVFCEDRVFLNNYILNCSKVVYLPEMLYYYCINEDSACMSLRKNCFDYREIDYIRAEKINYKIIKKFGYEEVLDYIKIRLFHKNDQIMHKFLTYYNGDKETLNYFRNNFKKYLPYCNTNPRFPRVSKKHLLKDRLHLQFPVLFYYLRKAKQKLKQITHDHAPHHYHRPGI